MLSKTFFEYSPFFEKLSALIGEGEKCVWKKPTETKFLFYSISDNRFTLHHGFWAHSSSCEAYFSSFFDKDVVEISLFAWGTFV